MALFFFILTFVFGAVIGSFLTAWVWRVREGKSMLDKHSMCPHCHHDLGPLDLLPIISYLLLRGRCRYCQHTISAQYPLVEIATATLFGVGAVFIYTTYPDPDALLHLWPFISLLVLWISGALLIALFVYDLKWGELPDIWTLGGSALVAIITLVATIFNQPLLWQTGYGFTNLSNQQLPSPFSSLLSTALSGFTAALFFYAIVWGSEKILHKPGMGFGDVKLALFMGLLLGFPGIIVSIYLAFILGAVLSLLLLAGKQKSWGQAIPFGPFLVVGTFLAWWLTPIVVGWYQMLLI